MRAITILVSFLILLIVSCSRQDDDLTDCAIDKVKELDMVLYIGQEIGCEFFLELYQYNNKQYFLVGSHCADIESYPFDCDGNQLCGGDEDQNCTSFYRNAHRIGVIGIGK